MPSTSSEAETSDQKHSIELVVQARSRSPTLPNENDEMATTTGPGAVVDYRLYRTRFSGCFGIALLNGVTAMCWPWFGPIANNMVAEFGITLDQVNWLGNIVSCIYLPTALLTPVLCSRYGIRRCCDIGAVCLLVSAWIRFSGTSRSLSVNSAYTLLILGQLCASISTAIFQVLGPKYSETWFGLKGRTTATMVMAISYPVGGAIGQIISPLVRPTRLSILVLGIISTAVLPAIFLINDAPPTPPTHAGAQKSLSLISLLNAMLGKKTSPGAEMSFRERIDFAIVTLLFSTLLAAVNTFAILTAGILAPVGYSPDTSGFMGAVLLLSGIVAAIVTAPLFDRVLTHHLAISTKCLVPVVAAGWVSLIWAVKPHNTAGLYAIMAVIGIGSITLLPIGLELGCELTRNADGSSAILLFGGNGLGIVFLLAQGALRSSPNADPPSNMRQALIFNGVIVATVSSLVVWIKGRQARKELDERKIESQA